MRRLRLLATTLLAFAILTACGGDPPDSEAATARFSECLQRNGITPQNVNVKLNDDGTVGVIEIALNTADNALYESALRLLCTQEVEAM